jgi:DNA-binding CsgD family transcriptional regulator
VKKENNLMVHELSKREKDVVDLVLEGKSNKMIASALNISIRTVEFHLKNIYDKFQVSSRVELVLKLGDSTVAGREEVAENRDGPDLKDQVTSLMRAVSRIGKELIMKTVSNENVRNEGGTLTFFESIRECFKKYAEFNGRASRSEFWWFALFVVLSASALTLLNEIFGNIFLIAVLLPLLAAGSRRLHDSGKSGWWQLFLLVPVGGIVLLGFWWASPPSPLQDDALPA